MIMRVEGSIHGNLASSHHQRHYHSDTISGRLTNLLTPFITYGGWVPRNMGAGTADLKLSS